MTIKVTERPKQTAKMDFKRPESSREYALWGSTDKTEILLAVAAAAPLFDAGIDATTGAAIVLFRGAVAVDEVGTGNWNAKVQYDASASTIELNFTLGVQSVKIQQALKDVASYSCLSAVSDATTTLIAAAVAAAATCTTTADAADAAAITVGVLRAAANTANGVPGVDVTVNADVTTAVTAATAATTDGATVTAAVRAAATATLAAATAATAGDAAGAAAAVANANTAATNATVAITAVATDSTAVDAASIAATAAAGGGNAQTLAAAAAAATLATGTDAYYAACLAAKNAAVAADLAAFQAQNSVDVDQLPGGNGVPDFKGAIGVSTDGSVEGVEIEVGKVEFSITKKWATGSLAGSYFATLADMTDRTVVNNATFTFIWMGQTLTFLKGVLRFRGAAIKWNSQGEVEITYHFAYQRSIIASDAFKIGNSAVITKEGWLYLWTQYKAVVSEGTTAMVPQSAHVNQVYPYDDFTKLAI